jgi:hypothetical protein
MAICGEMKEEFAKSARKTKYELMHYIYSYSFKNAKVQIQIGPTGFFKSLRLCVLLHGFLKAFVFGSICSTLVQFVVAKEILLVH